MDLLCLRTFKTKKPDSFEAGFFVYPHQQFMSEDKKFDKIPTKIMELTVLQRPKV